VIAVVIGIAFYLFGTWAIAISLLDATASLGTIFLAGFAVSVLLANGALGGSGRSSFRNERHVDEEELRKFNERFKLRDGVKWVDVYTASDPVPNGPLIRGRSAPQVKFTSVEIENRASAILDHTSYWQNYEQFVNLVASELLLLSTPGETYSANYYARLDTKRPARISALRQGRILATGAALLLAWSRWDDLLKYSAAASQSVTDWLEKIPVVGDSLTGLSIHSGESLDRVGAALLTITAAIVANVMATILWLFWDAASNKTFVDRGLRGVPLSKRVFTFFLVSLVALSVWQASSMLIAVMTRM
jgi:hypothetical protein